MFYAPIPAASEARSALPNAPVVPDRPPRRRLRLARRAPLALATGHPSARPARLIGARS